MPIFEMLRSPLFQLRQFSVTSRAWKPAGGTDPWRVIGCRDVVGHGPNGQPLYVDSVMFPYPSVRFRDITPVYKALREKEKGDWRGLTLLEKKVLYRISFCQTFAEFTAPTGEWKSYLGMALLFTSLAILFHITIMATVSGPLPESFNKENQQAQLQRMIDLRMGAIEGISSKWDYEKDDWKYKSKQ